MIPALVQARMRSTRLPGKVLADIAGMPALALLLRRLGRATTLTAVAVVTTMDEPNDPIADLCRSLGVLCLRYGGDEADVLGRYVWAAQGLGAETVVRITADCPLIDPGIVDHVAREHRASGGPLTSNVVQRSYPRGFDVECISVAALADLAGRTTRKRFREHPTAYWYDKRIPGLKSVLAPPGLCYPDWRLCVDEPADLEVVRAVVDALGPDARAGQIVAWLRERPELLEINRQVKQRG